MWNNKINNTLLKLNFVRAKSETCIYYKKENRGNILCILALYVDDIIVTGKKKEIDSLKT